MSLGASKEEIYQSWRIKIKITSFIFFLIGAFVIISSGGELRALSFVDLILGSVVIGIGLFIRFSGIKAIDYIDSKQRPRE
ncbi:MAG: hypothetical protein WDZ39_00360 [Candidatus Spechtbacterales bacterium]